MLGMIIFALKKYTNFIYRDNVFRKLLLGYFKSWSILATSEFLHIPLQGKMEGLNQSCSVVTGPFKRTKFIKTVGPTSKHMDLS